MSKAIFCNHRILFISVQTFSLEVYIKNKIHDLGGIVDYFDERPSNNFFVKALLRIAPKIYTTKIENYYDAILEKSKNVKYDYLFVIKGEVIPSKFIRQFKAQNSNATLIIYTWDSLANNKNFLNIFNLFDRKFSFDHCDSTLYNLRFRPLFFINSIENLNVNINKDYKYDLLFIGTAHSDRFHISEIFLNFCKENGLKMYRFLYSQGWLVLLYKLIFDSKFKNVNLKSVSFSSLSQNELADLYKASHVVLDINHPSQCGLTLRTIESIGFKRKLITTNRDIIKYCFFNPQNINIIDRDNINIDLSFFQHDYDEIDFEIYEKLSLEGWIKEIFFENDEYKWIRD